MIERLYTVEQAATEVLGIGRTRVYELLASGEIDSIAIGRLRRIPESALQAYIDKLKSEQSPDALR